MPWDPNSITQSQLEDYRKAAEQAWGEDTRHPDFIGHPQPSAGQCYVTSRWLAGQLGGHVGVKSGHYFWVSPDKNYVIDLTGDQFATPPADPSWDGTQLDQDDEPWSLDSEQKQWRPGPIMFKAATHPLYKGFRVKTPKTENPRVKAFSQRANAALAGKLSKVSDLLGPTPYPDSTPQAEEDINQKYMHDKLSDLQMVQEPVTKEYKFFYGSGQLHVSPVHSHDELREHSGVSADSNGPVAVGYVQVHGGDATWNLESNIAARGLVRVLKDYSKAVGWKWDGVVGGDGAPLSDDYGPRKSMWFAPKSRTSSLAAEDEGELYLSERPLHGGRRIDIVGRTAYWDGSSLPEWSNRILRQWADDFNYHIAEYPGGTQMTERLKNWETLDGRDRGDPEWEPEKAFDGEPEGPLTCPRCGERYEDLNALILHKREHEPTERIDDGHFPNIDMDQVLPLRPMNSNPTAQPIASYKEAATVDGFDLYSSLWGYDTDDGLVFYGGYLGGQMLGYGVVRPDGDEAEIVMIQSSIPNLGIGTAIANKIKSHYPKLYTHADSPEGEKLAKRIGMVNAEGQLYRYAAGQEPKDLIKAPIPFIYDVQQDHITTGHPGMKTSDVMGQFTPGGIVEGYYEPGGQIKIVTQTNMPYSVRHMLDLWYWTHRDMEITGVDLETEPGKTQKLAAESVGTYLKNLAVTDAAAWNSYQALRNAGGKVYVVGGAVRDALLGKDPKDIDLMVSGIPSEQVNHILSQLPGKVDYHGKNFGVYEYITKGQSVEIALPREDRYEGERRGQGQITVDHNLPVGEDLRRRDFTANSMAVDLDSGQLIDPYGGAKDIENHVLRTTHPSSFEEDPTRLVRALVASSRHGLIPDERTRHEMEENAFRLDRESPDALKQQLDKLMESPNPAGAMRLAQETGILRHMFPEVANNFDYDQRNPHHNHTLGEHLLEVLGNMSKATKDPDLRLAALLHDIGKPASAWENPDTQTMHYYPGMLNGNPVGADHAAVGADMAEQRLREGYNFPVSRMRRIHGLINNHMFGAFSSPRGARKFLNKVGDQADDLLALREADNEGKGIDTSYKTSVDTMRGLVEQARQSGAPTSQSALSVNGNDLIAMGLKPGPQIGTILRQLTNDVVEDPALNDREALIQRAQEYIDAQPE